MSVNLAAFYVVQKICEATSTRMEMGSIKRKEGNDLPKPDFAVGTQRDLKLNVGIRNGHSECVMASRIWRRCCKYKGRAVI